MQAMTALVSRDQIEKAFRAQPLFAALDDVKLSGLADLADAVAVRAGETLITEGESAGDVYMLLSGRLEASVMREAGGRAVVGEIGPGEVVGEMSMLSDSPRSATVSAVRDSTVLRLPRRRFQDFITEDAKALLGITQLLVHRLESANRAVDRRPTLRTIAVVPATMAPDLRGFATALAAAFPDQRSVEVIDRERVDARLGPGVVDAPPATAGARELARFLHNLEVGGATVVFVADREPTPWTARCIRQADRILLVGTGPAPPLSDVEREYLFRHHDPLRIPIDLVLVHASAAAPDGTAAWLRDRRVARHHHVVGARAASVRRLVRRITGAAVGLVLSGGGARGFAHIGVVRAFREAGFEFDLYGGASFGSSIAAQVAADWPVGRIVDEMVRGTVEVGSLLDVTFPYLSLAKGHTLTSSIVSTFGAMRIEDLPIEFYCVSSDLTAGHLRVHDRGTIADAVRASVAIPGIFPPIRSPEGHVLVDGGIMDNLPVAEMRTRLDGGRVVAVDLRTRNELPSIDLPAGGEASGWQPLLRRFNPARPRMDMPRMIDLLIRSTELASGDRHDTADVTLRPPVEGFGLLEFTAYEALIEAGYRYASETIEGEGAQVFGFEG
jgi:predicted acylesterase/phospholipase RssA/CRP-like cAMP-binding protein